MPKWNEVFGESLSPRNYAFSMLVIFWYVPLVLIAILYMTVAIKLKSQNIPGEGSANGREQHSHRQKNVLKLSIAIVVTFIVCWLPGTIRWFLVSYQPESTMTLSCGFQYFALIAPCLAHFNSAINPCISLSVRKVGHLFVVWVGKLPDVISVGNFSGHLVQN